MKEMRTLGRIILAGVALLVLFRVGLQVVSMLPLWFGGDEIAHFGHTFVSLILIMALAFGVILLCILRPDVLLDKLIRTNDREGEIRCPVAFAFRLVAVALGLWCLFWTAPLLVRIIGELTANREQEFEGFHQFFTGSRGYLTWGYVGSAAIRLAVGIYLVCGAPHFVRWQVKKTLEQCGQAG